MSEHTDLTDILNEAVSLEYTAAIQYTQLSVLLVGRQRAIFEGVFKHHAKESLRHAKMWGDRIVYLGGVPRAEVGPIRQSTDLDEMFELSLEVERRAVEIYSRAHQVCRHEPTRFLLENHILDEDKDVEEMQKFLGRVAFAQSSAATERQAASA